MTAPQGCWTCKSKEFRALTPVRLQNQSKILTLMLDRKIGCDRTIPHCNNCLRTKRACAGYGIRLVWPDEPSARRGELILCHVANATSPHDSPQDNHSRFLNFTWMDFCLKEKGLTWRQFIERTYAGPPHSLSLHSPIVGEDAILLAYCLYPPANHARSPAHTLQMSRS